MSIVIEFQLGFFLKFSLPFIATTLKVNIEWYGKIDKSVIIHQIYTHTPTPFEVHTV